LVSITVPKKVEIHRTDGLSQTEVESRLSALASTIDSRGWAVKNVDVNLYTPPDFVTANNGDSDRLVGTSGLPQAVPSYDVTAADDILDPQNNPIAQQFDQMITASSQAHRQQLMNVMHSSTPAVTLPAPVDDRATNAKPDYWFMQQPGPQGTNPPSQVVHPGANQTDDVTSAVAPPTADEQAQSDTLKALKAKEAEQGNAYGHMKTIRPLEDNSAVPSAVPEAQPNPKTQQLASNNDLNISTLARVAGKKDLPPDEEVVISLH
jgi:hypothetical protein